MQKIDLHMHSTVSDGTDAPAELLARIRNEGITLFSLTDHDAVRGCDELRKLCTREDPKLVPGVEFSCRDDYGKYHILGYRYDADTEPIRQVVDLGHRYRMRKTAARIEFLRERFGFEFPESEIRDLMALDNPGKPHIANLMVKHGYAKTRGSAIREYLSLAHFPSDYVRPEEAIQGILGSGGIPVLAHPAFGSGEDLITGDAMDRRLRRLLGFGLQGVEAFYSGFSRKLTRETLAFADAYGLYATAGSDYHGTNKLVQPGDTGLDPAATPPDSLKRFLEAVGG